MCLRAEEELSAQCTEVCFCVDKAQEGKAEVENEYCDYYRR